MRKTTTKILAMVLAVVMLVGIAPVSAFAQETKPVGAEKQEERISAPLGEKENEKESEVIEHIAPVSVGDNTLAATGQCGDNVYWTFDEDTGELVIHGKGKMFNNGIGPFVSNSSIKSIKIESGVTSIGDSAFYNCRSLTSINIPDSVTSIGDQAFNYCISLTSIEIPDSVTSIGSYAFGSCSSLTSIEIPDSVTSIGEGAFRYCSSLTSINIPDNVTSIGSWAFDGCSSLTSVEIPDSVTSIGDCAFYNCSSLTSVTIPDSVTSIGKYAFHNCRSLTSVTIGNSVTSIGDRAFDDCWSLNAVYITDIDAWAQISFGKYYANPLYSANKLYLNNELVESVVLSDSVTSIGDYAFENCWSLTSIEIPDSVTSIGEYAFEDCSSLTSVTIPDSVTWIGSYAFWDCHSLTSVTIGNSVTSIGDCAFRDCWRLTSIEIPDSVTSIGNYAFSDCSKLSAVYITDIDAWAQISFGNYSSNPLYYAKKLYVNNELINGDIILSDNVKSIGEYAFYYCSEITSITIPDSVTNIGDSAFSYCFSLEAITVSSSNKNYSSDSFGVLYNKDKTELIQYPVGNDRTSFSIPDTVTSIGKYAFYGCSSLTSIVIPDSVTSIGGYAFSSCSGLTSVTIGNSVKSIGYCAFEGCTGLTSIEIPNSVTSIGRWAFEDCTGLTSIEIPDSVTSIGYGAFACCSSLTSVTIPESVTYIAEYAFYDCPDDMVIFGVPGSYAQTYAEENDIMFVAVDGSPYVTIHCQPLTDTPEFTVYGVANLNTEISIYDGETLLTTAKSDSRGQWKTTVTLNNPANNSEHTIKAVVTKNEESKSASTVVTYDTGAIFPVEFTLTHSGNTINLLTSKTKNLTIVPSNNFVFNVKLNKAVSSLKVTSTKNGVTKSISATYNSATGTWTASGWFDPSNHSYAPGELGLEIDGAKVPVECAKVNYLIDPSGYVYEAVKSNRVEGASVIICYQDGEHAIPWDANPYEQENPQITDEMGAYHWDVTEGNWRVKVTKSGYETAYSDWMQVPPEWTEVAIPLVTTQSPEVKSVEKEGNGYVITFSQYMDIDSVNSTNVVFENNDGTIAGTITPVNKEVSGTDSSVYYASVFKFVPTDANAQVNAATINNVKNYVGITISETYTQEFGGSTPEHDHIPGQAVKEKEVSPSCTARGSYDEVVYCTVCGTELGRETKYVNALGHTAGEWMVTVQPTLTSEGTKELYCAVCGATMKTESIPKLTQQDLKVKSVSISDMTLGYRSSAVITPTIDAVDGAKYNVTYKSNSSAVSVDQSGRVTSNKTFGFTPGSAVITVTVTDTNGNTVSDTCTVTVQFSAIQWIIKIVLFGWIWY